MQSLFEEEFGNRNMTISDTLAGMSSDTLIDAPVVPRSVAPVKPAKRSAGTFRLSKKSAAIFGASGVVILIIAILAAIAIPSFLSQKTW